MTRTRETMTADYLNDWVEFGSPFRVHADSTVSHAYGESAPETLYHVETTDKTPGADVEGLYDGWSLMHGYTGQHGYSGAVMHTSEYLGGSIADDVLATPGLYVLCPVEVVDDETGEQHDEPAGWVVAHLLD